MYKNSNGNTLIEPNVFSETKFDLYGNMHESRHLYAALSALDGPREGRQGHATDCPNFFLFSCSFRENIDQNRLVALTFSPGKS